MNQRYVIVGTNRLGDYVRLSLKREDIVKEKKQIDVMSVLSGGLGDIQQNIQVDAVMSQQPDLITISFEEWERNEYKINDIIEVKIMEEK